MDVEHVGEVLAVLADIFVDAIDRTYTDTSSVDAVNAKAGYGPWHRNESSPEEFGNLTYIGWLAEKRQRLGLTPRIKQTSWGFCHIRAVKESS
jgi:hypothetical protein